MLKGHASRLRGLFANKGILRSTPDREYLYIELSDDQ